MFTLAFWNYAGERAIKTVAQSAVAFLGTGTIGLFTIDWTSLLSVSLGAGLLSILTSIITKKD
jgi:threonine dehydrogenase-like Zn-dependent dehydrogenase